MQTIRTEVRNGCLVSVEPVDWPEGTRIDVIANNGDRPPAGEMAESAIEVAGLSLVDGVLVHRGNGLGDADPLASVRSTIS